jgi:hypothetical protein
MRETDDFIIGSDLYELVAYYCHDALLTPIVIDEDEQESIEPKKEVKIVPAHQREVFYQDEGDLPYEFEWLLITIPLIRHMGISKLLEMRTDVSTLSGEPRNVSWHPQKVQFTVDVKGYGFTHPDDTMIRRINDTKDFITNRLHLIKESINAGNERLRTEVRQLIQIRKNKLESDRDKYSSLLKQINIPLKRKDDPTVKRIQLDTTPVVRSVRPTPSQPENYQIDREKIMDIISFLDNQGRQFEKTPATFKNSGEEDFRNILLINLNTVFEGRATGETFNASGKTDIHLQIAKGDILICECKIWGGQSLYLETIDQLLSYLTWRENYGIMITFIRGTKPTTVLAASEAAIPMHKNYLRGLRKIKESHFVSFHHLPTDDHRSVEVHHLFYVV